MKSFSQYITEKIQPKIRLGDIIRVPSIKKSKIPILNKYQNKIGRIVYINQTYFKIFLGDGYQPISIKIIYLPYLELVESSNKCKFDIGDTVLIKLLFGVDDIDSYKRYNNCIGKIIAIQAAHMYKSVNNQSEEFYYCVKTEGQSVYFFSADQLLAIPANINLDILDI